MKTKIQKVLLATAVVASVYSCQQNQNEASAEIVADSASSLSAENAVSSAASFKVAGRQFVKTAQVDMEVQNVYKATMAIEKSLAGLRGFVVHSNLDNFVVSEKTYNTSDTEAVIVRKFQSANKMEVRVPTEELGGFLKSLGDQNIFLNSRVINADDVTASIKYAEMEAGRNRRTAAQINQLKPGEKKVQLTDENETEKYDQTIQKANLAHDVKYSVVQIDLKAPGLSVAQIPVANTSTSDQLYSVNFWYDLKNALNGGYEMLQLLIIGIFRIWPLVLIGGGLYWLYRRKQKTETQRQTE